MPPTNPSSFSNIFPMMFDLRNLLPAPYTPWNVSTPLFHRLVTQISKLDYKISKIQNFDPEINYILKYFEHDKPPSYGTKRIVCIHNPDQTVLFELAFKNMEKECKNLIFTPKGQRRNLKRTEFVL